MPKRQAPYLTFTHHRVEAPKYTTAEIAGLKEQLLRLEAHVKILEEEAHNKKAQITGLKEIIKKNRTHARSTKV